MKIILYILGVLIILSGIVWVLQGTNILPGSYMIGNPQWTINGVIAIVIGGVTIYFARRRNET